MFRNKAPSPTNGSYYYQWQDTPLEILVGSPVQLPGPETYFVVLPHSQSNAFTGQAIAYTDQASAASL
jgi:hypothetical protein